MSDVDLKEIIGRAISLIETRSGDISTEDGCFATVDTDAIIHLEEVLGEVFNPNGDDATMEECWPQIEKYCDEITRLKGEVERLNDGLETLNVMTARSPEWQKVIKRLLNKPTQS